MAQSNRNPQKGLLLGPRQFDAEPIVGAIMLAPGLVLHPWRQVGSRGPACPLHGPAGTNMGVITLLSEMSGDAGHAAVIRFKRSR